MKKFLLAGCLLLAGFVTFAQNKSTSKADNYKWKARFRIIGAVPPSSSYDLSGTKVKVSSSFVPEVDFTYFFTKNLSAELILGTTKHNVKADDGSSSTKLGSVWLLPPTLNLQYHFPLSGVTPYIGAGINYSIFYGVSDDAAKLAYKNNVGFSTQVGADFDINSKWFINVDIKKIFLKTDVTANSTTTLTGVKVDPYIFGVGIGTKF